MEIWLSDHHPFSERTFEADFLHVVEFVLVFANCLSEGYGLFLVVF